MLTGLLRKIGLIPAPAPVATRTMAPAPVATRTMAPAPVHIKPRREMPVEELTAEVFRAAILEQGGLVIRRGTDATLLAKIKASLDDIFADLAMIPAEEFERRIAAAVDDPVEKDFWEQLRLGHIFDRYFQEHTKGHRSFFDVLETSDLRRLAAEAFPERSFQNSPVTNCRRVNPHKNHQVLWDLPISFHVDAQYFNDQHFSLNFWTPLVPCGKDAPSLQIVAIPVEKTKAHLRYNSEGYPKKPDDFAYMHKFDLEQSLETNIVAQFGEESLFAVTLEPGDMLVFSNFTLHRTYTTREMGRPRMSLEVRLES